MQLVIHTIDDARFEVAAAQLFGQGVKEGFILLVESGIEGANMVGEVGSVDDIIVRIIAAAHGVEQHIGEMACILGFVAGGLYAVVVGNDSADVCRRGTQGVKNELFVVGRGYLLKHGVNVAGILLNIHDEEPRLTLGGFEGQGFVEEICALYTLGFGFGVDGCAVTESVKLHGGCEQRKVLGINRVDGVASEAFAGFGFVHHNRFHPIERKHRAGDLFDLLVTVHEG